MNNSILSNWIRKRRQAAGFDTHQFAQIAHIDQSQISRLETGSSQWTLNALVQVTHALNINRNELLQDLLLPVLVINEQANHPKSESPDFVLLQDTEVFATKYTSAAGIIHFLSPLLFKSYQASNIKNPRHTKDVIENWLVQAVVNKHLFAVGYPNNIPLEVIQKIYLSGGVLNLFDAGVYLRAMRETRQLSIQELSKKSLVPKSIISRIEHAEIERLDLQDIANLDKALDASGQVFSIFWSALEFHTGISRRVYYQSVETLGDFRSESRYVPSNSQHAFILTSRWCQAYGNMEWLHDFRKDHSDIYKEIPHRVTQIEPEACRVLSSETVKLLHPKKMLEIDLKDEVSSFAYDLWRMIEITVQRDYTMENSFTLQYMLNLYISQPLDPDYQALMRVLLIELFKKHPDFYDIIKEQCQKIYLHLSTHEK